MSAVQVRSGPPRAGAPRAGGREARISLYFLLWLVAAPFVGFMLAGDHVFDLGARGDWETWKAAVIGGLLAIPFAVGASFGLRAVRKRFMGGWIGFGLNAVLALLAISMPVFEALTN